MTLSQCLKYSLSYSPWGFQLGFFCHENHRMVWVELSVIPTLQARLLRPPSSLAPSKAVNGAETEEGFFWDLCEALAAAGSLGSLDCAGVAAVAGQAALPPHLLEAGVGQDTRQGLGVRCAKWQWEQTPNSTPCPVIYILLSL